MLHERTFENGLRAQVIPFDSTQAVTVLVLCKVGSRYETPEINGASHFIEHLMFKGTKRRPNTLAISRVLDAVGAEYNAYTGKDVTGYYIKIDAKHLELAVDLLYDMLVHSTYKPAELKRERGVIIEEIHMYRDNPIMHVEEMLEEVLFAHNPLGRDIAGSPETMRKMTRKQVIDFHDRHYIPARLAVTVSGKADQTAFDLIEKTFGTMPKAKRDPDTFIPAGRPESKQAPRIAVEYKDTNQIQLAMGFPSYGVEDKRTPAVGLLSIILGGSMSSRLFVAVRERKGLAYMVRATNSPYEDIGNFQIQSGLDKTRLPLALKTIRQEVRKIQKQGVMAKELKEAKDHINGKILLRLEDSSERAEWYAKQVLFRSSVKSPEERVRELMKVTNKQIQEQANEILNEGLMHVAAIGPYKNASVFRKVAGI